MPKNKKILIGKFAAVLSVIPALLYAYSSGPNASYTGAPGDNKTACISGGCHVGTVNSFSGKVAVTAPDGSTYTPGATQRLSITISDASQKAWGFQLTARATSDNSRAGDLISPDSSVLIICADAPFAESSCTSQSKLQYAEHSRAGYLAGKNVTASYTYKVDWKAPATDVGEVTLYVAANASDGSDRESAGHIYTSTLKLTPKASGGGGTKPAITSSGGVVNGATFLESGIAPNTYITIKGTNLATTSRLWGGADFGSSGTQLPTALDGTSVTVNGKPAYVEYISPTQINAITPADTAVGSGITVAVTSAGQTSDAATVTMSAVAPSFFTFDGKYVAAADAVSNSYIGKTGLFASAPNLTTPAKPGQLITLYGTGFGPTTPALASGLITDKVYNLSSTPVITVGSSPAVVAFAGLVPPFAQVYQLNITIPASAPDGDLKIFAQTGGITSPNSDACCYITVKK